MRLNQNEIKAIKESVLKNFGFNSQVKLFGSRIDDQKKGGDIDLFIITRLSGLELQEARLLTMSDIQKRIGDQKIDIVTAHPDHLENNTLIIQNAKKTGILL